MRHLLAASAKVDDVQYIDVVMPMHNLIEYSDTWISKTSGTLWQYCRDEQLLIFLQVMLLGN